VQRGELDVGLGAGRLGLPGFGFAFVTGRHTVPSVGPRNGIAVTREGGRNGPQRVEASETVS
jgi:hypothetical protein